jgi:miniconductance mechanosensitive channel
MIRHIYELYEPFHLNHHLLSVLSTLTVVFCVVLGGVIVHKLLHRALSRRFHKFIQRRYPNVEKIIADIPVFEHFLMLLMPLILFLAMPLIFGPIEEKLLARIMAAIENILVTYILFLLGIFMNTLINGIELAYKQRPGSQRWPIRSYVQFVKGFTFLVFTVLIVSHLLGKSPLTFLTGLGAVMAIITLVFKDAILSFVASVQVATSDMMRKGDWIEIPEKNISGNIIEMSLSTIKIQNFDKSISTIPPYYITSNAVKNWRGMFDFGGRQMKLSITIDGHTIQFADKQMIARLKKIPLMTDHIKDAGKEPITNLSLFRHYIEDFIEQSEQFSQKEVFLAHIIQPSYVGGVPLEILAYTKKSTLKEHEHIQSELVEHIIAMMPDFELKLMQEC